MDGKRSKHEKLQKSWRMISKLSEIMENMTLVEGRLIRSVYIRKSAEFEERS